MHKNKPALMRVFTAFVACVATTPVASAGLGDFLLPKHDVRVIAVTDMTPAGASRPAVSPAQPGYYVAINGGYRDLGGISQGDKVPPQDMAIRTIAKVLAEQGYLPASQEHPASLILVFTWGTLYREIRHTFVPWHELDPSEQEVIPEGGMGMREVQVNLRQMLRFLGGNKVGLLTEERNAYDWYEDGLLESEWRSRNPESLAIFELASEDLFIATITAFDFAESKRGGKVMLWKTKISCPSVGLRMDQTLPTMLALAAPHIGRETAKPVSIKASDRYQPDIKIGDPEVVEIIDPLIVIDGSPKAKKAKERSQSEEGELR